MLTGRRKRASVCNRDFQNLHDSAAVSQIAIIWVSRLARVLKERRCITIASLETRPQFSADAEQLWPSCHGRSFVRLPANTRKPTHLRFDLRAAIILGAGIRLLAFQNDHSKIVFSLDQHTALTWRCSRCGACADGLVTRICFLRTRTSLTRCWQAPAGL